MAVSLEGMSTEAINDLAALAKGLSENPKTRGQFLGLMKAADPNLAIPEVDIPARIEAATKPHIERLAKMEREREQERIENMVRERRSNLLKKQGITEADIPEIEKMMIEKGISSHDTAADFFLSQRQSAAPTPSTGFTPTTMAKPDLKKMGLNLNQWARNEAQGAISDIIKNRSRVA